VTPRGKRIAIFTGIGAALVLLLGWWLQSAWAESSCYYKGGTWHAESGTCGGMRTPGPRGDTTATFLDSSATIGVTVGVPCTITGPVIISDSAVGPFRLEHTAAEVRAVCPSAVDTSLPNDDYAEMERGLMVATRGGDTLWLALALSNRIDRIDVLTAGPRTLHGHHVGSTLGSILSSHASGGIGEASFTVSRTDIPGVSFVLDGSPAASENDMTVSNEQLRRTPQGMRVVKIWVHGYPQ
jgi:hypothetical protein